MTTIVGHDMDGSFQFHEIFLITTGPPGNISDVNITDDTITACSFKVQWSKASSDPACDPVQYTVTIIEGGVSISTNTTTLTNYNVTGLNNNTVYNAIVTASNNAGSSSSSATIMIMTKSK